MLNIPIYNVKTKRRGASDQSRYKHDFPNLALMRSIIKLVAGKSEVPGRDIVARKSYLHSDIKVPIDASITEHLNRPSYVLAPYNIAPYPQAGYIV